MAEIRGVSGNSIPELESGRVLYEPLLQYHPIGSAGKQFPDAAVAIILCYFFVIS